MAFTTSLVRLPDGRHLEYARSGRSGGRALVVHGGTPNAVAGWPSLAAAAARNGFEVIGYSRPGYGASDPHPHRRVADAAHDTAALLDALGFDTFASIGVSGGGPHVLACAALLPDRCRAIADVCGLMPLSREISLTAGMMASNAAWLTAATQGEAALAPFAQAQLAGMAQLDVPAMLQLAQTTMPPADAAACTGELAEMLVSMLRRAFERGSDGYVQDSLAFVADPGFDLADIRCPVAVWHGALDVNVPQAHGRWVVSRIPHARPHFYSHHGHVSLLTEIAAIVDDLARLAR